MKYYLKAEIRRTLCSGWLWGSLLIGLVFVFMSIFYTWSIYNGEFGIGTMLKYLKVNHMESKENLLSGQNLYNSWIGADRQSFGAMLFYLLAPLLSALPCTWRFSDEVNSGYLHMIASRKGRGPYFVTKMIVAFIAGGTVLILPQIVSILVTALYIPATNASSIYNIYTAVFPGDMFSELFYLYPGLYLLTIIGINFVFGGLFAWFSMMITLFTRSKLAAIIIPFLFFLWVDSAKRIFDYISYVEISPLSILHPMAASNYTKEWIVILWIFILVVITMPIILMKGTHYEIS